jgi:hypothetical protein
MYRHSLPISPFRLPFRSTKGNIKVYHRVYTNHISPLLIIDTNTSLSSLSVGFECKELNEEIKLKIVKNCHIVNLLK